MVSASKAKTVLENEHLSEKNQNIKKPQKTDKQTKKTTYPQTTSFTGIYYAGHEEGQCFLPPRAGNDPTEIKGQGQGCPTKSNMPTYRPLSNKLKSSNPSTNTFLQITAQTRDENVLMHLTLEPHTYTA